MVSISHTPTLPHSHTFSKVWIACILCVSAVMIPIPATAADTSVMLADGQTLEKVTLKPGAAKEQLVIERTGQAATTVSIQDLLVVDFGKIPGRPVPASVRFLNGDSVFGKVTFPGPRQVKVAAGWGSVTAPLSWCSAIRLQEKAALPGTVDQDTLILPTDRVQGEIEGIANGKVNVKLGGKVVPVDLSRVSALAFAAKPRGNDDRPGLRMGLDLGGGEKITGQWVALTPDVLTVKTEWGANVEVPVASLSRLEVKNGKLVYLSDLKPAEIRLVPYLDGGFTLGQDRSVGGRPLRLAGKAYARGLGTHSRSDITYALDGGFQTFAAKLGIDDAVGASGSVIFRVFGDDKLLFESAVVRGGDTPVDLKLAVKGVLLLRLEVDYADGGDAADQADWADARLLRP